jgi:hypothetical protein
MEAVFQKYKELFHKRYQEVSVLDLAEDSVRYDFFLALQQEKGLEPWQINLEYPLTEDTYVSALHRNSKRKEKPQVDLMVNTQSLKLSAEFGFFRRNSNIDASIKVTENTFKMLNDFIRLAIHSHITGAKSYFVCVADAKMLEYQLGNNLVPRFPGEKYTFKHEDIKSMVDEYKSAKKEINSKFLNKLQQLDLTVEAKLVFYPEITTNRNSLKTQILIWEIKS